MAKQHSFPLGIAPEVGNLQPPGQQVPHPCNSQTMKIKWSVYLRGSQMHKQFPQSSAEWLAFILTPKDTQGVHFGAQITNYVSSGWGFALDTFRASCRTSSTVFLETMATQKDKFKGPLNRRHCINAYILNALILTLMFHHWSSHFTIFHCCVQSSKAFEKYFLYNCYGYCEGWYPGSFSYHSESINAIHIIIL